MTIGIKSVVFALFGSLAVVAGNITAAQQSANPSLNDPETCSDIWKPVQLPVSTNDLVEGEVIRNDDGDEIEPEKLINIICRDHFITRYNSVTKTPDWVIEKLSRAITMGDHTRPKIGFGPDMVLPAGTIGAVDRDYRNSGLARGHQAASADFKSNSEWMHQTFIFSNAVPQLQKGFNGGIWRALEDHTQDFAKALPDDEAIIVITGPVYMPPDGAEIVIAAAQNGCGNEIRLAGVNKLKKRSICDANDKDAGVVCKHGVAVPAGLYKIIFVPKSGRVIGFLFSNEDHGKSSTRGTSDEEYFENWRASVNVIEEAANLDFFPGKSRRWRRVHEESCTATRWR